MSTEVAAAQEQPQPVEHVEEKQDVVATIPPAVSDVSTKVRRADRLY